MTFQLFRTRRGSATADTTTGAATSNEALPESLSPTSVRQTIPDVVSSRKSNRLPNRNFRLRWVDKQCEECPICYTPFENNCVITLLPCGHYFCQGCMDHWLRKSPGSITCPMCRYDCSAPENLSVEEEAYGLPNMSHHRDSLSASSTSTSTFATTTPTSSSPSSPTSPSSFFHSPIALADWSSELVFDDDRLMFTCESPVTSTTTTATTTVAATSTTTAATTTTTTSERPRRSSYTVEEESSSSSLEEYNQLSALIEQYSGGENFQLILSKALRAKHALQRQVLEQQQEQQEQQQPQRRPRRRSQQQQR